MAVYNYVKPIGTVDLAKLQTEITAAGIAFLSVTGGAIGSGDITVTTIVPLSTEQEATLNAVIAAHDGRARRARPVFAIFAELAALGTGVQDGIIADLQLALPLNSNPPPKWTTIKPPQDGSASAFRFVAVKGGGYTAAEKREAAGWIVSMYCQQNPKYLVNPPGAPTVNIPGDEIVI